MPPDETMRLGSLRRQIRADHLPALAAVRRREDHLAAVVDGLVIERIDRERRRPVAAVLRVGRRRVERDHPGRDRARGPLLGVVARQLVAVARRPDDVGIGRIRDGEAGLAAAECVIPRNDCTAAPTAATASSAAATAAGQRSAGARGVVRDRLRRVARAAHRPVVLPVAVDPVRHLVVDGDVVHLPDRQRMRWKFCPWLVVICIPPSSVIAKRSAFFGSNQMSWQSPQPPHGWNVDAAVGRSMRAAVGDEHFVGVGRRDAEPDVVAGAADQRAIPAHDLPRRSAVVRAPERALIGGLNQRVDAVRVRRRDRDVDLADRRLSAARRAVTRVHVAPPSRDM